MNVKNYPLFIFLMLPMMLMAQEAEVIGMELRKGLFFGEKDQMQLGIRVPMQKNAIGISTSSQITRLSTVEGTDLWVAKKASSNTAEAVIDFEQSRILPDTLGFLLLVNFPALPPPTSCKMRLQATLFSFQRDKSLQKQVYLEDLVLAHKDTINLDGRNIAFKHYPFRDSKKGSLHRIQFDNDMLGLEIDEIVRLSKTGEVIETIELYKYPNKTAFDVPDLNESIDLRVTYAPLSLEKTEIDISFGIAL